MDEIIYEKKNIKLWWGDALEVLKGMPDESVDMVMTSPPYYGLRIYLNKEHSDYKYQLGLENTYQDYLAKMLLITAEIKRVLKKTGSFWLNMGDCYGGSGMGMSYAGQTCGPNSILQGKLDKFPKVGHCRGRLNKCLIMMPERLALKMVDEQGWILRNKIKWVKQIYIHKQSRTMGSVMPTSVKDRFNESGEELYFFVKSKKYYADLDSVRISNQTLGVTDLRTQKDIEKYQQAYRKQERFNYRVRDAKKKSAQCPQFKAMEEEIKKYKEHWIRPSRAAMPGRDEQGNSIRYAPANHRDKNDTTEKNYGLKKYNTNPDPRGDNKGGPGSYRLWKDEHPYQGKFAGKEDAEMFNSPRARTQRKRENIEVLNGRRRDVGLYDRMGENPQGKNLPSCWLISTEPHSFSKEFHCEIDHFATFPQDLVEIPIRFGCPKGGIVLDLFAGSCTTGVVAIKLGRQFWGIDLNKDYLEKIAIPRIERELGLW